MIDENEIRMRRIAATTKGRASFDVLPAGAPTCLTCKGPPAMVFWKKGAFWTVGCPTCGGGPDGAFDSHANAIAAWTKSNARTS